MITFSDSEKKQILITIMGAIASALILSYINKKKK